MRTTNYLYSGNRQTTSSRLNMGSLLALILMILIIFTSAVFAQARQYYDMSLEELMNIEISTSAKTFEKVSEVPASVIVITRKEIEAYGCRSLGEILEHAPGFYSIKDLSYQPNFGVRGFFNYIANRNVIFMINGVWQGNDFEGSNRLESFYIPVEAIDRIEVIRGPMSVMYGSGGSYGAINIFTNEIPNDDHIYEVSTGYGTSDTYKFLGRSRGKGDNFSYSINIAYNSTYGLDEPYSKMGGIGDIYGEGINQNSGGRFEFGNFHFDTWASFNNLWTYFSYDRTKQGTAFLFQPLKDGLGSLNLVSSMRLAVGYRSKISDLLDIDFKVNYIQNSDEYDYEILREAFEIQRLPATSVIGEINAFIHPSDAIDITAGINFHSVYDVKSFYDLPAFNLPNSIFSTNNDPIITRAAYVQVKWRIINPIIIIGGLRLERQLEHKLLAEQFVSTPAYTRTTDTYSQDKILPVPRLAAIFSINPSNVVKLLYGRAINRPAFFEKANMTGKPYPQLIHEKIETFEVNYNGIVSRNFSFSLSLFKNELSNLIIRETGFDNNSEYYSVWSNYGKLVSNGFECQVLFEPHDNTRIDLAITYQSTADKVNEEMDVAYSPHLLGYLKVSYRITPTINIAVLANYVDEMLTQWDKTPVDVSDPNSPPIGRIGNKIDAYFNVSMNLRAENLLWNESYLNFNVANIFDKDIYSPTTQNSIWAPGGTLHGGRSFYLTIGTQIIGGSE